MNQVTTLSLTDAQKIVAAIQAELEKDNRGAAIAIVDVHGELIAFARTDSCPLSSITIAINKAFTASRQRQESKAVGQSSRDKGWPLTNFGDPRYTGWGGGVPIVYNGQVIGAVGVSGLPEADDMVLAAMGAGLIK